MSEATRRRPARPRPGDELPPLVEAKLAPPRLRPELVERPRILRALDAGEGAALTLVAAPAGYGKTTAVRAWCASRGASLAWVTLDAGDNDPVRLWTYVATAVDRVREGLGRSAIQRLRAPGTPVEDAVAELTNGIAAFGHELVVVLDELEAVTDPECLATIDHAVEQLPQTARLVVIARTDPSLSLARLRVRGALAELRAGELAFTTAEVRQLLASRGHLRLDSAELEMLCERTEGWPAAIELATLWLQGVDDPGSVVRDFRGNHRFVADFLSHEVLDALDEETRSLMLRASVLGRFTAELCDAVLGRSDSAAALERLERSNLFVTRLEHGGWYRIHPLFAEFAIYQLGSVEPEAATEIHRRAAAWLVSRDLPVEAAEHAAAAGDFERVAELLTEYHLVLLRHGSARTLLRWTQVLPDEQLLAHPVLAGAAATAAAMVGSHTLERRRYLELVERARATHPDRAGPYVEAIARMVRASSVDGDVNDAVEDGRRAVELAEREVDELVVASLAGYARALYFAGDLDGAWEAALRAVEHPDTGRRTPGHAFARSTLALVAADRGRVKAARANADRAKSLLGGVGSSRSWLGANASAALGVALAAEGDLAAAERELVSAEHFFRDEVATPHHVWLLLLLARVRGRRGRLDAAGATLRDARDGLEELPDRTPLEALAADVERELVEARSRAGAGELLEAPSEAELAVLRVLGTDLTAREIGATLYLSPNTVRSHMRAIYRKLGVGSRADAVARAGALGLLDETESPR